MTPLDPVAVLQQLIRFDTTTPPGGEAAAIGYVRSLLSASGIASSVYEKVPGRPNLVARIPGAGRSAPLLMQAHIDVVPADPHGWTHPPFSGSIADGFVWGRGALDMKGGLAMMLGSLLSGVVPAGDVILAVVSDEEGGGAAGASYLVDSHPSLFAGIRYALGEFGGFTIRVAGRTFSAIQVAEKQICRVRVTLRGPGGHGSLVIGDGVSSRLGHALTKLSKPRLPVHVIPVVGETLSLVAGARVAALFRQPRLADAVLRSSGSLGALLTPMLRNTATPNLVSAGSSINVQPTSAEVQLDGRVLPGFSAADLVAELSALLGPSVELTVDRFEPYPSTVDMGLFPTLASVVASHQPGVTPLPILLPASTDGRHFARLGIQSYGFTPMVLPPSLNFTALVHGVNERIPVAALPAGVRAYTDLLTRF